MSLSKVESNEDIYRRDSFSDRVCDYLSLDILQYLSLEDKLRLECVSKLFQRTITSKTSLSFPKLTSAHGQFEVIKKLLKKFLNSDIISVALFAKNFNQNEMIEQIINYSNKVTHLTITYDTDVKEEVQRKFINKFGHELIYLKSYHLLRSKSWFTYIKTSNIEELSVSRFDPKLNQIKFNKLKSFHISYLDEEMLDQFKTFVENNARTLKHLSQTIPYNYNKECFEMVLKIVSKLINLVHLESIIDLKIIDKSLTNYWKEIAINCKQIKSLRLYLRNSNEFDLNHRFFSSLKEFKLLKRLDFKLGKTSYSDITNNQIDYFRPIQDLKGLEGLTHLSIELSSDKKLSENFLTDIDINFPKLQSLNIDSPFNSSEWTAQVLGRLSSLETIWLWVENKEIGSQIERQLIKNCRKFKRFTNLLK